MIIKEVSRDSKMGSSIISDFLMFGGRTLFAAYQCPSDEKVSIFENICSRYYNTLDLVTDKGVIYKVSYNNDISVTGNNTYTFYTIATFTDNDGAKWYIKETPKYRYGVRA